MKKNTLERMIQAVIMLVLFVLIFFMIAYVNDIQGTARVVNYAGLVRGDTQRLIKLEITKINSPQIMKELNEYIDGIQNGSNKLNLVKIEDSDYQEKVAQLCKAWENLKLEINNVRKYGYLNTNIVLMSEDYFHLSNEVVALAENYSQMCATNIRNLEVAIIICIVLILLLMLKQSVKAIQVVRMNRELKEKVFWDEQTGLPNKNKCAELLSDASLVKISTTFYMFDLNNLKYVNDNMGHGEGDTLICNFAKLIREGVPQPYFVGRYGGDEFIVILSGEQKPDADEIICNVSQKVEEFNKSGEGTPISYAVGYAQSEEFEDCTLRILLAKADKKMYENKKLIKKNMNDVEKNMDYTLMQMVQAMGNAYKDCCLCNAKTGTFRTFNHQKESSMPQTGVFQDNLEKFVQIFICSREQERILQMLDLSYIKEHLNTEHPTYSITCHLEKATYGVWWRITVMFVDADEEGELFHYLVLFEEISREVELEYEAKHDGLTKLWNKTTALSMIESLMINEPMENHIMFVLDIDNFKQVNDTFGHNVGDEVLKKTADIISSHFRKSDIVSRFGGDEFFVFATGFQSDDVLKEKAQMLLDDITEYFHQKYDGVEITISIGIARANEYIITEKLFHKADEALYRAKKSGKNKFLIY